MYLYQNNMAKNNLIQTRKLPPSFTTSCPLQRCHWYTNGGLIISIFQNCFYGMGQIREPTQILHKWNKSKASYHKIWQRKTTLYKEPTDHQNYVHEKLVYPLWLKKSILYTVKTFVDLVQHHIIEIKIKKGKKF